MIRRPLFKGPSLVALFTSMFGERRKVVPRRPGEHVPPKEGQRKSARWLARYKHLSGTNARRAWLREKNRRRMRKASQRANRGR